MSSADPALQSVSYELADAFDANELYQQNGWTDGLPIVPPTEERVREFLDTSGWRPADVIGVDPLRRWPITAEKLAINAVMAGCLPAYFPVVVAVFQAMCRPEFNLHGSTASTGGSAQLIIVNGPIRTEIGMNATHNVLGNASRANATIGRAVRLTLINVLECIPGRLDRSTFGQPGKFTYCIAEDEEDSPWPALAQERGVAAGASAVTVMGASGPRQILNEWTQDPEEILETFAAEMRHNMLTYSIWSGNYTILIPKQLRELIAAAGWTRRDIQEYIFKSARLYRREWAKVGKRNVVDRGGGPDQEFTALRSPDALLIVAAGGPAGGYGIVIPPWLGPRSIAQTQQIGLVEPVGLEDKRQEAAQGL
ncbi:MAG TPA: hypothetical protein VHL09_12950 [Dehalococcoidia bacterium]|nr:hypothetical protein [Dehalococcoidia bacterium]